ncbi:L-type lectin family protein [Levilactobacillus suantsaiihabitans]|uniref:WxL domain-containing protein n=1 Tax=Levilactobacillus suantsaiihabitans TaxID=2487722 RepID=A0A4Z0J910_9LACO|nr:hypothetical protein [Levilactobacillus suantsaiihabitans]TGD18224.1 hypothetical protein EGT51_09305 [Levilactobacillus suantsaiihabitans]
MKLSEFVLGLLTVGMLTGGVIKAHADTPAEGDVKRALRLAPQGVKIDDYFEKGDISNNSAKIVDTGRGEKQAVQLTDGGQNELGILWTSDLAKMNLQQDQTASMWLYTGNSWNSGDGMAFVMQNDERGIQASALDQRNGTAIPATGETLGVWGYDVNNQYSAEQLAKAGIQKSWALEFDTFLNRNLPTEEKDGDSKNSDRWKEFFLKQENFATQFDLDKHINGKHIASGYPGDASAYQVFRRNFKWDVNWTTEEWGWGLLGYAKYPVHHTNTHTSSYPYAVLKHDGLILTKGSTSPLSSGYWQHVTLVWDASASEMKYTFGDKDPKTGAAQAGTSCTVRIDKCKLGLKDSDTDQRIRWGFTGSTGANTESNLVVFEQVPSLVSVAATAQLTDMTRNKSVNTTDSVVHAGDRLKLTYDLKYISGRESWKDVQAKLQLPSNVRFTSAKVEYSNGYSQTLQVPNNSLAKLADKLNQELSADNLSATISLNGIAAAGPTAETAVSATNSSFAGINAIAQTSLTGFKVIQTDDDKMQLRLTGPNSSADGTSGASDLTKPQDVEITGNVSHTKSDLQKDQILTIQPVLNGIEQPTQVFDSTAGKGNFTYKLAADRILSGRENTLKLYVTDSEGRSTNDVTYTVTLAAGFRELAVSPKASFNHGNPVELKGAAMTLPPDNNWQVTVNDTKQIGDQWELTAKATSFISKLNQPLPAYLAYVTKDGTSDLQQGMVTVLTHRKTTANPEVVNVANTWQQGQGLLLKVGSDAVQGSYYSEITWVLRDVPKSD